MLRSVVSHTIGSNCAMVRADALTSRRTCLALLQAAVSHTIGSNWAMVREDVSTSLDLARRTASDTIGTSRALVHADGCTKKVSQFQTLDATGTRLAHHRL